MRDYVSTRSTLRRALRRCTISLSNNPIRTSERGGTQVICDDLRTAFHALSMLTFVVSHQSPLVSHLVAFCLQQYFGRTIKIFVVDLFDVSRLERGVEPWCGVSTISSLRGNHWEFLEKSVLYGTLRECLIPLNRIQVTDRPGNRSLNPDLPFGSQQLTIVAHILPNDSAHSGLIYHPDIVVGTLRHIFANSSNIFFTLALLEQAVLSMILQLPGEVVWINFGSPLLRAGNDSMVIQSKLSSFKPILPQPHLSLRSVLPRTILWIPLLRAILGLNAETNLQYHQRNMGRVRVCNIHAPAENSITGVINQRCDLLYCLKICNFVLDCVGDVSGAVARL